MKIVFFGTSEVGLPILNALLEAGGGKEHEIALVVTSPDAPVGRKQVLTQSPISEFAEARGLTVEKPARVKDNPEFLEKLRSLNADIFIVVSYGKILPLDLLNIPPLKTLNVHFSLLPKYRGAAPIQYALLNGEEKTGTTIFVLDELVDHGPILAQAEFKIDSEDTFDSLAGELAALSAEMLIRILPDYQSGKLKPQEQNHDEATSAKLIKKEDGKIDWSNSASHIRNMWRAYTPWPGIYTTSSTNSGELKLKILDCIVLEPEQLPNLEILTKPVGTVTVLDNLAFVTCGQSSALLLLEVQLEGKNPTNMRDFVNGRADFNGSVLS